MSGNIPPLPQYAFMAWCSVRGSTGTTLPFTLSMPTLGPTEAIIIIIIIIIKWV
jgi:hypothetical protein